jgi:tol-pal system protein YbgF
VRIGRRERAAAALAALAAAGALPGCYAPQLTSMRAGLDSLRAVVDTIAARDSTALALIGETRREMAEQRDILLSTRATTGTTTQELFEQMGRLEGKLDEVMGKFQSSSQRSATPGAAGAGDPNQLYDQASQDLTQGRYALALRGFRDFLERHPQVELSDNAQYGIGESFFAQSVFDSAALEYARVEERYPKGDRVPAALYKLGLSRERQGKTADAKKTFEDLVKRFPNSGEAQLARERLGGGTRR